MHLVHPTKTKWSWGTLARPMLVWVPARGWARWLQCAACFFCLSGFANPSGWAAAKYFIKVRDTELAAGTDAKLPEEAKSVSAEKTEAAEPAPPAATAPAPSKTAAQHVKDVLLDTLRKQPDVTLEIDTPLSNPSAAKEECKRKGLRPFEFAVRVLRLERNVKPAPAGKRFRSLEQIVKLSLIGTTWPEGLLAVGGDGESTIQIEIGERVTIGQEREVFEEAVKDAVEQAVRQGMQKLSQPLGKPGPAKRRTK